MTRKVESADVHVCGGLPRSSVEISVMEMERRGVACLAKFKVQLKKLWIGYGKTYK